MPCFGAAFVDVKQVRELARFETFVRQPPGTAWDATTVSEFWEQPKNVAWYHEIVAALPTAPTSEAAGAAFCQWVAAFMATHDDAVKGEIVVVSDTAGSDYMWLSRTLPLGSSLRTLLGFDQPTRDTTSFHLGLARSGALRGGAAKAAEALELEFPEFPVRHSHRPADDAAHLALQHACILNKLDEHASACGGNSAAGGTK